MRPFDPPDFRRGDPLTARYRNDRNDAIRQAGQLSGSAGIVVSDGLNGRSLSLELPECTEIKLTTTANGDGGYGAKEVLGAPLGTWADSGRVMPQASDPAYERDHNVSLSASDRVYRACRCEQSGEWIFRHKVTSGGGGGTGVLGCVSCSTPPATLYVTAPSPSCVCIADACTLQYGPTPDAAFIPLIGTDGYFSTATFIECTTLDAYYWYMDCLSGVVRLKRAFPSFLGGGAFIEASTRFWSVGSGGATCAPFAMVGGSGPPGYDPTCVVEIHE